MKNEHPHEAMNDVASSQVDQTTLSSEVQPADSTGVEASMLFPALERLQEPFECMSEPTPQEYGPPKPPSFPATVPMMPFHESFLIPIAIGIGIIALLIAYLVAIVQYSR